MPSLSRDGERDVSVYLHIPFCRKKCVYCDFPSWAGAEEMMEPVTRRMEEEIASYRGRGLKVREVFFGGGTPSVMPPEKLLRLMRAVRQSLDVDPGAEISMEINPGTLSEELLDALNEMGVGRVSMGMQSSSSRLLKMLGRIHRFGDVVRGVESLRARGISEINLDLMTGLPSQTMEDVRESVRDALALGIPHMSCYSLIPEEGTVMMDRLQSGEWTLPGEDEERDMVHLCRDMAREKGLEQYEISNYAVPGHECRYNTRVWRRGEYLGIGCAASGHLMGVRWTNPMTIREYLDGAPAERTVIGPEEARFETVMLGLRLLEGVREKDFIRDHGMGFEEAFGDGMQKSVREGLLTLEGGVMRLTERGLDLQNRVLVRMMTDQGKETAR